MRETENETQVFEFPPETETPVAWETTRPRYFGVTPHGFAAALAAVAFGAGIVLVVTGSVVAGVLLLVAAVLLATLYAEQARRRRDSTFDRVAAATVDRTRALAGFTRSSVRAWTGAGRAVARLRLETIRLARQRAQLQYALGGAAYADDAAEETRLRGEMKAADDRIAECVEEAHAVLRRARATTAHERFAVAPTEVRDVGISTPE